MKVEELFVTVSSYTHSIYILYLYACRICRVRVNTYIKKKNKNKYSFIIFIFNKKKLWQIYYIYVIRDYCNLCGGVVNDDVK